MPASAAACAGAWEQLVSPAALPTTGSCNDKAQFISLQCNRQCSQFSLFTICTVYGCTHSTNAAGSSLIFPLLIDLMLFDAVSTSIGCKSTNLWCTQVRCHGGGGGWGYIYSEGTLYAETDIDNYRYIIINL